VSVKVWIEPSKYAVLSKVLRITVNGSDVTRTFLNDHTAPLLEAWLAKVEAPRSNLLDVSDCQECGAALFDEDVLAWCGTCRKVLCHDCGDAHARKHGQP
jgi:hypothetical protein